MVLIRHQAITWTNDDQDQQGYNTTALEPVC